MKTLLHDIKVASSTQQKLLAVLIDPDKFDTKQTRSFLENIHKTVATHIFVGGSTVKADATQRLLIELKKNTHLPIILFPGDVSQVCNNADAILYLSLISGRNPDYLIEQHVKSVSILEASQLEIIPTGYILVESGKTTRVQKVTQTQTLNTVETISKTAKAGQYLGMQLIYLEAGSGAEYPISKLIISKTKQRIQIPLIVGGGIRTKEAINSAYDAGADLVVIGTAFEKHPLFYKSILKEVSSNISE